MGGRRRTGDGSIFQLPDGRWRAMVDLGWSGGKRRRKAATRATRREAAVWLRDALRAKEQGALASRSPTVAEWFTTYFAEVAAPKVRPLTMRNYRRDVDLHVLPTLGRIRLDRLQPTHLSKLYRLKLDEGLSSATVRHIHAVLRRGLTVAVRWGLVARNVAQLVDPPPLASSEIQPLSVEEARALLRAACGDRLEARWVVGLSLGMRQGEALGLCWEDVDLEQGIVLVRRQLTRASAPGLGVVLGPLKSARSRRVLALPKPLVVMLRAHKARQAAERLALGGRWFDDRLVFATEVGTPIDHRNDARSFKTLCRRAGVRPVRVHDLRHTAATLLIAQGQHPRVVMEVLGHSQIAVTMNVYGHVLPSNLRDAASAVSQVLWGDAEAGESVATRVATRGPNEAV
jgi:integrase